MHRQIIRLTLLLTLCGTQPAAAQEAPQARHVTLAVPVPQADGSVVTAVGIDAAADLLAADIDLRFDAVATPILSVRPGELIQGFFLLSNIVGDTVRVSFAGGSPAVGEGTLFEIVTQGPVLPNFAFVHVSLNGDQIPAIFDRPTVVHQQQLMPPSTTLPLKVYPNPFNSAAVVSFDLPQAATVQVAVFNLLGQRIRTLAHDDFAGGSHQLLWNGFDDGGGAAASGPYLVRLRHGDAQTVTPLMLAR